MGRPRIYQSRAEQQAAYRQRQQAAPSWPTRPTAPAAKWRVWRAELKEAMDTIDRIHGEIESYIQERSEDWQNSDKGSNLLADLDELYG